MSVYPTTACHGHSRRQKNDRIFKYLTFKNESMTEILPVLPRWVDVTAMSTTAMYGAANEYSDRIYYFSGTISSRKVIFCL